MKAGIPAGNAKRRICRPDRNARLQTDAVQAGGTQIRPDGRKEGSEVLLRFCPGRRQRPGAHFRDLRGAADRGVRRCRILPRRRQYGASKGRCRKLQGQNDHQGDMTKHTTRPWRDNTEQAASPRPGDPVWGWVFLRACRRPALLSAKVVSADRASDLSAVIYRKQVQNIMIKNEKLSRLIGDKERIICYNKAGGIYTQTRITEMEGSP